MKCFGGTCSPHWKCCEVFCALIVTVKTCVLRVTTKKVVNFFESLNLPRPLEKILRAPHDCCWWQSPWNTASPTLRAGQICCFLRIFYNLFVLFVYFTRIYALVSFVVLLSTPEVLSAARMPKHHQQQSVDDIAASLRRSRDQDGGCAVKRATNTTPLSLRLSTSMTSAQLLMTSRRDLLTSSLLPKHAL